MKQNNFILRTDANANLFDMFYLQCIGSSQKNVIPFQFCCPGGSFEPHTQTILVQYVKNPDNAFWVGMNHFDNKKNLQPSDFGMCYKFLLVDYCLL